LESKAPALDDEKAKWRVLDGQVPVDAIPVPILGGLVKGRDMSVPACRVMSLQALNRGEKEGKIVRARVAPSASVERMRRRDSPGRLLLVGQVKIIQAQMEAADRPGKRLEMFLEPFRQDRFSTA
jgi:hypothetical protein